MTKITAAQQSKINKILDTEMNFDEDGIMSRREWLRLKLNTGATVATTKVSKVRFDRSKYNRLAGKAQAEYEKSTQETKLEYRITYGPYNSKITKIEYDFFLSLQA